VGNSLAPKTRFSKDFSTLWKNLWKSQQLSKCLVFSDLKQLSALYLKWPQASTRFITLARQRSANKGLTSIEDECASVALTGKAVHNAVTLTGNPTSCLGVCEKKIRGDKNVFS
jgi:hypothetical protein